MIKNKTKYALSCFGSANDEFPGQYFYLKFVSDSSVTRDGFNVSAEYR